MNRQFLLVAFTALIILTGCGSAQKLGHSSWSAAARPSSAAARSSVSDPVMSVQVGHLTEVFSTPLPAGQAQARVIEDFREAMILWDTSEWQWDIGGQTRSYVTGQAYRHLQTAIMSGLQQGIVPGGTDRMFGFRVTALGSRTATIVSCDDGSRYRSLNRQTGRADSKDTVTGPRAYLKEDWHMTLRSGHWAISSFTLATYPSPAARPCEPTH